LGTFQPGTIYVTSCKAVLKNTLGDEYGLTTISHSQTTGSSLHGQEEAGCNRWIEATHQVGLSNLTLIIVLIHDCKHNPAITTATVKYTIKNTQDLRL
jgi:hypothetical protein